MIKTAATKWEEDGGVDHDGGEEERRRSRLRVREVVEDNHQMEMEVWNVEVEERDNLRWRKKKTDERRRKKKTLVCTFVFFGWMTDDDWLSCLRECCVEYTAWNCCCSLGLYGNSRCQISQLPNWLMMNDRKTFSSHLRSHLPPHPPHHLPIAPNPPECEDP